MNKIEIILQQDQLDRSIREQAILYKGEVYSYFDQGLTRYVFANADKTKVIKLLIRKDQFDFNKEEAIVYELADDEQKKQLAHTQLTLNGMVVEQEFCEPQKFAKKSLTIQQMMFASSCRDEVGWTADGRLVCYDLSEFKKY